MAKRVPMSGGKKMLPTREDLERQPLSFFASGKAKRAASKYTISGVIQDDEGDPVPGVLVTLSGDADDTVLTGVAGTFSFADLPNGDYTVTPTKSQWVFTPVSRSVTGLSEDTALAAFEGVGSIYSISGTISGDIATGVTVTLSGDASDSVVTGGDGTYVFEDLPDGDYTVTPSLTGYTFSPASTNVTINNGNQSGKDFTSSEVTYAISGNVMDWEGADLEGVLVSVTGDATDSFTTLADGNFSFDLPDGSYTLTATKAGVVFTPLTIAVTVAGSAQANKNFSEHTFAVTGAITDWEGADLSGVLVTITGDHGTTDTTGVSGVWGVVLPAGSYVATPTKAGVTFNPASLNITVVASAVSGQNFAEQVYALSGNIKDWEAANLSGVLVSVTGDQTASDTTDASGNYSIDLPNGSYTLTPTKAGVTFNPVNAAVVINNSALAQNFAEQVYAVSGTIYETDGTTPLSGVLVSITGDHTDSATTGAPGTYSFDLPNGSYTVTPTKAGRTFTPSSRAAVVSGSAVAVDDIDAEALTYTLSGEILNSSGTGVDGITVVLSGDDSDSTVTAGGGLYSFTLPDGSYTVTPTNAANRLVQPASAAKTISGGAQTADFTEYFYYNKNWNGESVSGLDITWAGTPGVVSVASWYAGESESWNPAGFTDNLKANIQSGDWIKFVKDFGEAIPNVDLNMEVLWTIDKSAGDPGRGVHAIEIWRDDNNQLMNQFDTYGQQFYTGVITTEDGDVRTAGNGVPSREEMNKWMKLRLATDASAFQTTSSLVHATDGSDHGSFVDTATESEWGHFYDGTQQDFMFRYHPLVAGGGDVYIGRLYIAESALGWPSDS